MAREELAGMDKAETLVAMGGANCVFGFCGQVFGNLFRDFQKDDPGQDRLATNLCGFLHLLFAQLYEKMGMEIDWDINALHESDPAAYQAVRGLIANQDSARVRRIFKRGVDAGLSAVPNVFQDVRIKWTGDPEERARHARLYKSLFEQISEDVGKYWQGWRM